MPRGDGTGPQGKGSMTGRGTGMGGGSGRRSGMGGGSGQGMRNSIQPGATDADSTNEIIPYINVDENLCTGCSICVDVCPRNAITINKIAEINPSLCTGCSICVNECPTGALSN